MSNDKFQMKKQKFDVICIGDTMHDVFLELSQETKVVQDTKGKEYLGLVYAEKIPVDKLTAISAVGNSANVAIGISRLGLKSALYTMLGEDSIAQETLGVFKKEGVAKDYIIIDKGTRSNFSVVLNYKAERTILVYHERRTYKLPKLALAKWLYYSSLAKGHDALHREIPKYVKKNKAYLGFNPGSHQLNEGIAKLRPILKVTTVLFVNREEAQFLVGKEPDIKKLMAKLHKEGVKIVAITDGPKGSYASDGNNVFYLKVFPAPLVERTGAGDSFSTGFISALVYGKRVENAMCWGTVNSASVIGKIGAREGLLRKQEVESILKKHPSFKAKKI
ncbi:MAG: carbohydrate kinase family protein [bacterium]|nr:carbohydrate kinase family protein [bacterium]